MQQTAFLLIVITLFLLVIIVGLLSFLIYKVINKPNPIMMEPDIQRPSDVPHPDLARAQFHPAILDRIQEMDKVKPKRSELFCPNHTDEPGETTCAICDRLFCKACIKPFKTLHFCKEHLPLIMRHEWQEVLTLKTSTTDPEMGVHLYDVKKKLFEEKNLPSYIETHYKINVDQDYIETYLVLFGMEEKVEELKAELKSFS